MSFYLTRSFCKYYLPAVLWAVVIFTGSSIPSHSLPSFAIKVQDLILHFVEYTILGFCLALAFMQSPSRITWKFFSLASFTGILYGASDEFHQKFVSGRVSSFNDLLADSAGVLFGLLTYIAISRFLHMMKFERGRSS